ncbi:DUF4062 domain-containing protein [Ruegeria sp. Alg231-54]|uniref:DUF4062 domain-containing protein n=1 Tax=Ruegeria sp. Alg231-54 TaxID=1922221 RepID=UPI000D558544|nr:DUF4062 domain-containing protein [Ruegeria sp. Alg231-54]
MVRQNKVITVFISSPSDVSIERSIVGEVIEDINRLKGDTLGYQMRTVTWENDVIPTFGETPQAVIDKDVGDEYDVFLGIMSTRFGTPTDDAASGTEHEFEKAYARKIQKPNSLEIMFYFQEPGHSGRSINIEELAKVEKFKSNISDKGLYALYKSTEEFKTKVSAHLSKIMDRVVQKNELGASSPVSSNRENTENNKKDLPNQPLADPLSFLTGLDDAEEPGLFELSEQTSDALSAASIQLGSLNSAVTKMAEEIQTQAAKLNANPNGPSQADIRTSYKESSRSMEAFVETSAAVLPLFHNHLSEGIRLSRDLIIILSQDNIGTREEREELLDSFVHMRNGMQSGLDGFVGLSETLASLPRATSFFNRAKKRTKAVVDGICGLTSSAIEQIDEIIEILNEY